MTEYDLDKYNLSRLRKIGEKMGLPSRRSKNEMIKDIEMAFREYEEYKRDKLDRYKKCQQLGRKGKEGTTYLVVDKHGNEFAMKTFRSSKSSNTLKKEYLLQKKAAAKKISPQVYDYDTVSKYILMEKMDEHFFNLVKNKQKGRIFKFQQKRIIEIFTILDQIGIFHNDANMISVLLKKLLQSYVKL
jgi:predicted Ser/Thr protein kinase